MTKAVQRRQVRVTGIVQGVGYRPFVFALANDLALAGHVGNDAEGVFIEVEGDPVELDAFLTRLHRDAPPLAATESITCTDLAVRGEDTFVIVDSIAGPSQTYISPDMATCDPCLAEVLDPTARRHRYAFTNCTGCGPRFTITRAVPYDRPSTTMASFPMCTDCRREYDDPRDRRFHAQPICCPACGPALRLVGATPTGGDPLLDAAAVLRSGGVLAVKGLGGYHLAAVAADDVATAALRARKHREDKPFAVLVADPAAAEALAHLDPAEVRALTSPQRPIVLARRRPGAPLSAAVAPGSRRVGLMLPYTPLHHLLVRDAGGPLVLTSGNVSDEPIAYRDDDALERLSGIADAFLLHDREIHVRTDDSVVRVTRGTATPLRRSRGYAPAPLALPWSWPRPVLGCGAELKSTFCLGRGRNAVLSHHIGDLENAETFEAYTTGIAHLCRLFEVTPEVVAHDLHPGYLSTQHAESLDGVTLVGVQHHHAHVAACLADNEVPGPVIGLACDGLGYGSDGTLWGGEVLVAGLAEFVRAGHVRTITMPGGAAAIREPWRMAAVYAQRVLGDHPHHLAVHQRTGARWDAVLTAAAGGVNAPVTSSVGRLLDACAALLGVRDTVTYEGQAAIELEQAADVDERGAYPMSVDSATLVLDPDVLVAALIDDLREHADVATCAARVHNGIARSLVEACTLVRDRTGVDTVAVTGGVFQNELLIARVLTALEQRRFRVLTHRRVPPNDGGISLGQAVVAGARDRGDSPALPTG